MNKANEELVTLISEFQEWALFGGKYSQSTIARDSRKIRELSRYFDVQNPRIEYVRRYFLDKMNEGVARQSLNVTRKSLMKWFTFLNERHNADITFKIPKQKEPRTSIKWIPTNDQVKRIIREADSQKNREIAARAGAIMRILFSGGLRIGEVARINLEDIRPNGLFVRSEKGEAEIVVGISDDALNSIRKYIENYRRPTDPHALFTAASGRMDAEFLRQHISRIGKKAVGEFHPHSARHWVATTLLTGDSSSGFEPLDIRFVQTQLRHTSLTSTQVYTHVNPEVNAERVRQRLNKFFRINRYNTNPFEPVCAQAGPRGFEPPTYGLRVHRST